MTSVKPKNTLARQAVNHPNQHWCSWELCGQKIRISVHREICGKKSKKMQISDFWKKLQNLQGHGYETFTERCRYPLPVRRALFSSPNFQSPIPWPGMFLRNCLSPMEATLGPQSAEQFLCSCRKKVENSKKTK